MFGSKEIKQVSKSNSKDLWITVNIRCAGDEHKELQQGQQIKDM